MVIERAQNLVAVSNYDSGRLRYLNPAGRHLMGLADEAAVGARRAPEFFTDVGVVQAPEMEAALLERGLWEGRSEFRHFLTGEPIPVTVSIFVVEHTDDHRPAVIACIAQDLRAAQEHEQRLHTAMEAAAYRAREQQALAELSRLAVDGDLDDVLAGAADAAAALMGVTAPRWPGPATRAAYCGCSPTGGNHPPRRPSPPAPIPNWDMRPRSTRHRLLRPVRREPIFHRHHEDRRIAVRGVRSHRPRRVGVGCVDRVECSPPGVFRSGGDVPRPCGGR